VPIPPLPMTADPTPELDVEALFDQTEQEAEERDCFSAGADGPATPGPATTDE
jgi:hypothetical protein